MLILAMFNFVCLAVAAFLHEMYMHYSNDYTSLSLDMTWYEFEKWCVESNARQAIASNFEVGFFVVLFIALVVDVYYLFWKES